MSEGPTTTPKRKPFNANDAAKLAASAVIFAISLVGLHYNVEYAGWGVFLAVILVWGVA